jgi:hypothetical protein
MFRIRKQNIEDDFRPFINQKDKSIDGKGSRKDALKSKNTRQSRATHISYLVKIKKIIFTLFILASKAHTARNKRFGKLL